MAEHGIAGTNKTQENEGEDPSTTQSNQDANNVHGRKGETFYSAKISLYLIVYVSRFLRQSIHANFMDLRLFMACH